MTISRRFGRRAGMMLAGCALAGCAQQAPVGPGASLPADAPRGAQYYVEGMRALDAGDRDAAVTAFVAALRDNPDLRMVHVMLGGIYRERQDFLRASFHYENLARLDPYTVENHYYLGVTYQLLGRLKDAAGAYLRALELDPQDLRSNMNLGLVYLSLGQVDDSVLYLERATRIDPSSADAWANLGVALDVRGSSVLAESTYRKALELDSTSPATLMNLGSNLIAQGKSAEAIAIMEEALKRSDTPFARKRYGDALALGGRLDQALQQYDAALQGNPRLFQAMNDKAFVLIRQYYDGMELDDAKRDAALGLLRQSMTLKSDQPLVAEAIRRLESATVLGP